jgi:hypothetical protein
MSFFDSLFGTRRHPTITASRPLTRPALEMLEDRAVPTASSITASFNGTAIPAGDTVWFNSEFKAGNLGTASVVNLYVTGQTITFNSGGSSYSVNVPDATIQLSKSTTVATTAVDTSSDGWNTSLQLPPKGNSFLSGASMVAASGLPGGIKSVTWSGNFTSDTKGVTVSWQWGAAVYSNFSGDNSVLSVKPQDGSSTTYNNGDHAGTPEAYKPFVVRGGTGDGGTNWTGNLTPAANVTTSLAGEATLYPFASPNPLTSIAFSESDVLVASKLDVANGTFDVWYTDEHALSLGVRQVNVITASGTTTTNYSLTPLSTDPGSATNPVLGTTATSGDQAGVDLSGRPIAPSLYITDTTVNGPNSLIGDWQYGGQAYAPNNVFGAWKGAVRTVNYTTGATPTVTVTCDADPARNGSNLGVGADTPPVAVGGEGYGAEVRWNLSSLGLIPGHTYRFYVMVHDGDQNKSGGDAGQAAYNLTIPGQASPPATLSGTVLDANNVGIANVVLTLTDANGNPVSLPATTDQYGNYTIYNIPAGTNYTVTATSGTSGIDVTQLNSSPGNDGTLLSDGTPGINTISNILLNSGDTAVLYNFHLPPLA